MSKSNRNDIYSLKQGGSNNFFLKLTAEYLDGGDAEKANTGRGNLVYVQIKLTTLQYLACSSEILMIYFTYSGRRCYWR